MKKMIAKVKKFAQTGKLTLGLKLTLMEKMMKEEYLKSVLDGHFMFKAKVEEQLNYIFSIVLMMLNTMDYGPPLILWLILENGQL